MEAKSYGILAGYRLGKLLGDGQFSKVRVGTKTGVDYAVKYLKLTASAPMNAQLLEVANNEAEILIQLDHPNIVKLFEHAHEGVLEKPNGKVVPVLYLVLELIKGGELLDYIVSGGQLSEKLCRYYFKQLISALEYIYLKGFAHRDIKPHNIFLDEHGNLKLGDFGFAGPLAGKAGDGKMHSGKGTKGYMAPEIVKGLPYSGEKVDLFAAGVMLFCMVAGFPPFTNVSSSDTWFKLFYSENKEFWNRMSKRSIATIFSPTFMSLINSLLAFKPENRATVATLKADAWYNEEDMTPEQVQEEIKEHSVRVEEDRKKKEALAEAKRKLKKDQKYKEAALGGMGPHSAFKGTKSEKSSTTRVIKNYKVLLY